MSLPEQIAQRFHNTQIDIREPLRRENDVLTAEYLARGGNVHYLPNQIGTPKPWKERTEKPKESVLRGDAEKPFTEEEIQAIRYMKAMGLNNPTVAAAINAHFKTNRSAVSIKSICYREQIIMNRQPVKRQVYKGKPSARGDGWLGQEDAILRDLTAQGKTVIEISDQLTALLLGGIPRTPQAVRGRTNRLGMEINRKGRKS